MNATSEVAYTDPRIVFYGPQPCDVCGSGPIVRGSVELGFGDIRLNSPNEAIYPNHKWEKHVCTQKCGLCGQPMPKGEEMFKYHGYSGPCPKPSLSEILPDNNDLKLQEFLRDSAALKTKSTQKWEAWMSDREDGIVGTGETELEAIKALADQYRDQE